MARKKNNQDNGDDIQYHKYEKEVIYKGRDFKKYDLTNVSNDDLISFTKEDLGLTKADSKYVYKLTKHRYMELMEDIGNPHNSIASCISRDHQLSLLKYLVGQYGGIFYYKLQFI